MVHILVSDLHFKDSTKPLLYAKHIIFLFCWVHLKLTRHHQTTDFHQAFVQPIAGTNAGFKFCYEQTAQL